MHMLTKALRSYVLRTAWEREQAVRGDKTLRDSANAGLVMNFSEEIIQRVANLNMDIHGAAGGTMNANADKLVRDAIIWTHLAGDSLSRIKVVRRLLK
jgi:alkylation response protein AidB-like acyl-CoA dehydrogenase